MMNALEAGITKGKEKSIATGQKTGSNNGILQTLVVMVQRGRLTIEEAKEEIRLRPEKFLELLENGI